MTKVNNKNIRKRERNTLYETSGSSKSLFSGLKGEDRYDVSRPVKEMPEVKTIRRSLPSQETPESIDLRKKIAENNQIATEPEKAGSFQTVAENKLAAARDGLARRIRKAGEEIKDVVKPNIEDEVNAEEASVHPETAGTETVGTETAVLPEEVKADAAADNAETETKNSSRIMTAKIPPIRPSRVKKMDLNSTTELKLAAIQSRLQASGKYTLVNHKPDAVTELKVPEHVAAKIKAAEDEAAKIKAEEEAVRAEAERAAAAEKLAAEKAAVEKLAAENAAAKAESSAATEEAAPKERSGVFKVPSINIPTPNIQIPKPNIQIPRPLSAAAGNQPMPHRRIHRGLIAAIIIVLALIGLYIGGYYLWQDRFLPNSFINAQSVSNLDAQAAETRLLPQNQEYNLLKLEGKEAIPLSSFNYKLTFKEPIEELIEKQNYYLWPLSLFSRKDINNAVTISYDEDLLEEQLRSLDAFNEDLITDPADAHLGKGPDGHYQVIPEVMGNRLDFGKTFSLIRESLNEGNYEIDITTKDCYLKPSIYSDSKELHNTLKLVKALGEETISIDMTGETLVIEPTDIIPLVKFDLLGGFTINDEALAEYVNKLASKYNTYLTERDFTTHWGRKIKVGGNHTETSGIDTYGFLMNREQMTAILRDCILSKKDQSVKAVWDVPALTRNDVNGDIGDTYIEISLTEQHLWQYKKGKMVFETDVVTGLDVDARRTPWGVFRAYDKAQNVRLKGEMAGERWDTPVAYWISVTWTAVGIHDATWQPTFGGDWYKYGGSHGCINVPLEAAASIYELVDIDTPIVIYY